MTAALNLGRRLALAAGRQALGTVSRVETSQPVVALTFDDGPDPDATPRLLEILERHGARGTFFMLGNAAQRRPDLVRRVAEGGHAIGNHSWDHPSFPFISGQERRRQIRACADAVRPYGAKLLRPPFGYQDLKSRLDAWGLGYWVVGWSLNTGDWYRKDVDGMVDQLRRQVTPGDIVLMHDALFTKPAEREHHLTQMPHVSREEMLETVEAFLAGPVGALRFVTVPELLRSGRPTRRNWYVTDAADWERLGV
jgi:peptidoglycan/xylan/chitin deacetylase (PgdA/CDA1 family)